MQEKKVSVKFFVGQKGERGGKNEKREVTFPSFGGCGGGSSF